jgi:hypothetical protein
MREPSKWFDHSALDSVEDRVAEAIASGLSRARVSISESLLNQLTEDVLAEVQTAPKQENRAEVAAAITAHLVRPGNIGLRAAALCFAVGLNRQMRWKTVTEAAEALHVTKQALSKVICQMREDLNLPHNEHSKRPEVCATLQRVQTERHWRNRTF